MAMMLNNYTKKLTMMNASNKLILVTLSLILSSFLAKGGNEKMSSRLLAPQIQVGGLVIAADNKFPNVTLSSTAYIKNSTARISLALNNYATTINYLTTANVYLKVGLSITYYDAAGNSFTQTQDLVLDHKAAGTTNDKSNFVVKNAHAISAQILYFKDATNTILTTPLIPSNLYIDAEVETERYYAFNPLTSPVANHNFLSPSNELMVYWNTVPGAEEYELEYTFVNNYNATSVPYNYDASTLATINTLANSGLEFTFNNNATRIRTNNNSFNISLNYDRGLIVYRLRAIGRNASNMDVEQASNWSLNQPQTSITVPFSSLTGGFNDFYNIATGHEENKNWQLSTTFAEEGKKKEVISYYDGSNKKRQTVTRNSSDYVSLIAETMYDSQGRPAISVLPSPYNLTSGYDAKLKYFEVFNQSATQAAVSGFRPPFSRVDFETGSGGSCPSSPGGMHTNVPATSNANGASLYYSSFNTKKQSQNAYLPDAETYPFTQTVYTPDNTGRVKYQTGVGAEFKMGNGRETKNLYGDPDPGDLDKLFASEAGYSEKYKKNMVVDANGQISVSYLNTEDKVVATALAGNAPANVNALGNLTTYAKAVNYMDYQTGNYSSVNVAENGALTFKKKIIPDLNTTYNFFYDLTVPKYTDNCITPSFCYDCAYDLDITLKDECNNTIYTRQITAANIVGTIDYACSAPIYFSSTNSNGAPIFAPAFSANLTAGKEYFLTKVLTINNDALNTYLAHYINPANNTCVKDLNYFQGLEQANINNSDCQMTCPACSTKVEQYYLLHSDASNTDPNYIYMSLTQKQQAIDQCLKPCKAITTCQAEFETMLLDMRPGGQYAQYAVTSSGVYDASTIELSIFNDNNYLRLSTITGAPANIVGTPFVTYDVTKISHWRTPEYYNASAHNFSPPAGSSYTQFHYFDADGSISKVRLTQLPGGGYSPSIVSALPTDLFSDNLGFWTYPENLVDRKDFIQAYSNNPNWAYSLVKNHPEFNYFLDCDREGNPAFANAGYTSERFDEELRNGSAETYAQANGTAAGINFGNTKWPSIFGNAVTDLVNFDPYFNGTGPGVGALKTAFQARLTNYKGTGASIKKLAAQMYSSAQMYYAPAACANAVVFGATSLLCNSVNYPISTAGLDAMWKTYRDLYLAEKQAFIMEQAHIKACTPTAGNTQNNYYNGAIGDQNFSPWDSYNKYGFFPFFIPSLLFNSPPFTSLGTLIGLILDTPTLWPNYANGVTPSYNALFHPPNGLGYFDFGSPSSYYHKGRYANKIRRVPDTQTLSNALAGGANNPTALASNLSQNAETDIYFATGQCPIYKRLELFITSLAKLGYISPAQFGAPTKPLVPIPGFTKDLYDAIIAAAGLPPNTWIPLGVQINLTPPNIITISFYNMTTALQLPTVTNIVLTNISGPNLTTPNTWNQLSQFSGIKYTGFSGANNFFTIDALYYNSANSQPYSQVQFSGVTAIKSSCANLATAINNQNCKPTEQALDLQNFLSAVVNDYTITSIPKPINLGNMGGNNSSSYFTTLVRYPFSTAAVAIAPALVTHSVEILPGNTTIQLRGKDGNSNVVNVNFVFTPTSGTGPQNLLNAVSFGNMQINSTSNNAYDFTIVAYYTSGSSQTFQVKINYTGPCTNDISPSCRLYKLKNCEPYVPLQCSNNNNYKTKVQLQALLNEMFTYGVSAANTSTPLANLSNYTNLLQSQIGIGATNFQINTSSTPATNPANSFNHVVKIDFRGPIGPIVTPTLCSITFNFNNTSNNAGLNTYVKNWSVFDIQPIGNPYASAFNATIAAPGGNLYAQSSGSCLKIGNCEPCGKLVIFKEDFESYTSTTTAVSQLNFTTLRYDPPVNYPLPVACPYTAFGNCPPISAFGQFGIIPASSFFCGFSYLPPSNNNYLVNNIIFGPVTGPPSAYIMPYITSPISTNIGAEYEISFAYGGSGLNVSKYKLELIVNDGTNDIVLNSIIKSNCSTTSSNWQTLSGTYFATSTNMSIKIKVSPVTDVCVNPNAQSIYEMAERFGIDDITVFRKDCESEKIVPIVDNDPQPPGKDCMDQLLNIALANGQQKYNNYLNNLKQDFKTKYTSKCYQTQERLQASYQSSEGHYTLYYYDQAGNLVKTIPPEGVEPINLTATEPISGLTYAAKINADRDNKTQTVFTNHRLATRYEYNSLNQLVKQQMPDHVNTALYTTNNLNAFPSNIVVSGMDFSNPQQGYFVGSQGAASVLYVTNNGGNTWSPASGITSADIIDVEYFGTKALAILADGSLLYSSAYSPSSPGWTPLNIQGTSNLQFTDIEYDAVNALVYITGKNGLLLISPTNVTSTSWTTASLGTINDINRIDFNNGYGVIVGNNGTVFYTTPLSVAIWTQFFNFNTNVDLFNCSIFAVGTGPNYINVTVAGVDKNLTPNRGTVSNINSLNGPTPAISLLYINSNANFSKIEALATNVYVSGPNTLIDVFLGGYENNPTASPIMVKMRATTPNLNIYTNLGNITGLPPGTGIKDIITTNAANAVTTLRVLGANAKFFSLAANATAAGALQTPVSITSANRIVKDINSNVTSDGLIAGNGGLIISYKTSNSTTFAQTNVILPVGLTAISAAKDGSGRVMAVGSAGAALYSPNFGNTWSLAAPLGATSNLLAVKYIPRSVPKFVVAGTNNYIGEFDAQSPSTAPTQILYSFGGTKTYYGISYPPANPNDVFLVGANGTAALIDTYTSPGNLVSNKINTGTTSLRKIDFSANGTAIAVGLNGVNFRTINNGVTFVAGGALSAVNYNDVIMIDQFTAYAFGASSNIRKTTDGGVTWGALTGPATSNFNAAYNFGNGNILVAGGGTTDLFRMNDQANDYASRFFYDALGRLVISQNSKQYNKVPKAYSYTTYDALGRITEVGEINGAALPDPITLNANINGVISLSAYTNWLTLGAKTEVTKTFYDATVANNCAFTQENLRKRVSATYIDNDANLGNGYTHASYYSYDIHGNVKSLLQENPAMPVGHTCKKIDYTYDLISGKVNKVSYQADQIDAWYHKYDYDADNRITNVYTSKDNVDWTQDAKYFYYLHGPLARVEIGQDKVQGLDYAYTLQGWIKGINSVKSDVNNDIGKDGLGGSSYNSSFADLHKQVATDAAAYALHYYGYLKVSTFINDYKAIEPTKNTNALRFDADISTHTYFTAANSLFNGNIMAMATTIYTNQTGGLPAVPQLATYKYDQLNRLNLMQATRRLTTNQWFVALTADLNSYRNEFTYDPSGNINTQKRYNAVNVLIDNMTYKYHTNAATRKISNRLYHVNDAIGAAITTGDIDDQGAFTAAPTTGSGLGNINISNNYAFDEIGNLIKDNQEGIASVGWTVYGKINNITRTGVSTARNMVFAYDAAGNRISKTSYTNGQASTLWNNTYYVRDAQGNIMAVYDYKPAGGSGPLQFNLVEHPIYGSSRLGERNYYEPDNLNTGTSPYKTNIPTGYVQSLIGGNVSYEISNHLGNVLTVVSDRKLPIPNGTNPNQIDRFRPDILTSTDYYAFGAPMPGRQFNNGSYRYGFNGKENDNEVKGTGNQQDYGMRIYDTRLGRFLSTDPITREYPELTPYQFASNTPIQAIDLDGLEAVKVDISARGTFLIVSAAISIGVVAAPNGVAFFVTPEVGIGAGASVGAGVSVGYFPNVTEASQLGGWGASIGGSFMGNGGDLGISVQQNENGTPTDTKIGASGAVPKVGVGFGAEGHATGGYAFQIGKTYTWKEIYKKLGEIAKGLGIEESELKNAVDKAKNEQLKMTQDAPKDIPKKPTSTPSSEKTKSTQTSNSSKNSSSSKKSSQEKTLKSEKKEAKPILD
jgi:RHS repeat-associated protein